MTFDLTLQEGGFLVQLARRAIAEYLEGRRRIDPPKDTPEKLFEKRGVFVTLNTAEGGRRELRGCIGVPEPIRPLVEATIDAAIDTAVHDPRFTPVTPEELKGVLVEVSVLTPLQKLTVNSPKHYPTQIKVGVDGLVVERGWNRGLLLPLVAVEWEWDEAEFLSNCCLKAGLTPDAWLLPNTKIYKFQALVFEEETPKGRVMRLNPNAAEQKPPI